MLRALTPLLVLQLALATAPASSQTVAPGPQAAPAAPPATPPAPAAVPAAKADEAPAFKISGLAFGDYYYVAANHRDELVDQNGFWFRRIYLTTTTR